MASRKPIGLTLTGTPAPLPLAGRQAGDPMGRNRGLRPAEPARATYRSESGARHPTGSLNRRESETCGTSALGAGGVWGLTRCHCGGPHRAGARGSSANSPIPNCGPMGPAQVANPAHPPSGYPRGAPHRRPTFPWNRTHPNHTLPAPNQIQLRVTTDRLDWDVSQVAGPFSQVHGLGGCRAPEPPRASRAWPRPPRAVPRPAAWPVPRPPSGPWPRPYHGQPSSEGPTSRPGT